MTLFASTRLNLQDRLYVQSCLAPEHHCRLMHLHLYKCLHASEAPHGQVATCPLAHVHPEKSIKKMFETWGFYGTSRLLSLGNITASRMFSRFSMVITSLDSPRPHPLWEGMPYLKA